VCSGYKINSNYELTLRLLKYKQLSLRVRALVRNQLFKVQILSTQKYFVKERSCVRKNTLLRRDLGYAKILC